MTIAESNTEEETKGENARPIFCKSLRFYFREYCQCSSLHGFRYFGEKRTYFERFWWFIVFTIVVAVCAYQIKEVYQKWERSPVIVSFATSDTPIYSIPFPAVTICPESKSRQSLYNHTDIVAKLYSNKTKQLNTIDVLHALYMSHICDSTFVRRMISDSGPALFIYFYKLSRTYNTNDFFDFLNTSSNAEFLHECTWMGKSFKCEDIFMPIITDEGICQTFNMLDRADMFKENVQYYGNFLKIPDKKNLTWSLDDGYSKNESLHTYPRRAMYSGVKNALSVTLTSQKEDIDYVCTAGLQGFKVILHTPMRIPSPSNQYFRVPLNQVVLGSIQPVMITTSDTVKVYNPKRRECYFPSERQLKYMKIYTKLNCQLECLTNFTLSLCKCVNFHMPRDNDTKICGAAERPCMDLAEEWLQAKGVVTKLELYKKLEELKAKSANVSAASSHDTKQNLSFGLGAESANETAGTDDIQVPVCDCMPICTDLSYDVETSQSDWEWNKKWRELLNDQNLGDVHTSKLILYFKNSQFVTSKRHELYGPTDFLANFGGLLGLFTGFSVLSVMEIIYFLTVRLCCNVRLYGAWYGPE